MHSRNDNKIDLTPAGLGNKLIQQVFSIPIDDNKYLIYAPLKGVAFLANPQMVNLIFRQCSNKTAQPMNVSLRFLYDFNFFTPEPLPKDEYLDKGINYDAVVLFLTNQCNMRCTYCYASSGEFTPNTMKWEIAQAAIDYVLKEAKKNCSESITLGFHGGGEPTLNWDTLTKAVRYTRNEAKQNSLGLHITGSFNGYWPKKKLDFILKNFTELSMSFDGIPLVQNRQRPAGDNRVSFPTVAQTLNALDERQFSYGIRMTVTEDSVDHLGESVSFICKMFNPKKIQVEPVFLEGRAIKNESQIKNLELFIRQFMKSHEIAEGYGITLFYSGARPEVLTQRFCLAACRAFVVTPEGDVTACFETYGRNHPLSDRFLVGQYDGRGGFVMDNEKLNRHFSRVVDNIPYCQSCYCRWHCAGDCAIKTLSPMEIDCFAPTERCYINRELTKWLILHNIRKNGGVIWRKDRGGSA